VLECAGVESNAGPVWGCRQVKILLVSDLHYALKQFDWTAAAAVDFDIVIIAGDHLDVAGQLDGGVQVVVILNYLKRMAAQGRVIVSSGNHDLDARDSHGEKVASWMRRVRRLGIATDGDSVDLGETLITICPWWDGPAARQAVAEQLERDAARRKGSWIWVYHAPPEGPTSWTGQRSHGDAALTGWIEAYRPDIVFSGHIHEAPFKRGGSWVDRIGPTWVFNCGQQIGPVPTHVALDTDVREAAWFSLAGAEIVRLGAPLERPLESLAALPAWMTASSPGPGPSPA
jgi:Icc-related predicted phosphoesterase